MTAKGQPLLPPWRADIPTAMLDSICPDNDRFPNEDGPGPRNAPDTTAQRPTDVVTRSPNVQGACAGACKVQPAVGAASDKINPLCRHHQKFHCQQGSPKPMFPEG